MIAIDKYLKNFIHDKELSLSRIRDKGLLYRVRSVSNLILTDSDFKTASKMYKEESDIIHNNGKITKDSLFRGIVYCIMTSMQDYYRQSEVFTLLRKEKLDNPRNIVKNKERFSEIMKRTIYNNNKTKYIFRLCDKWPMNGFHKTIVDGIDSGVENEREVRKYVAKNVSGLAEKTSSLLLRMCGYQNLTPVDSLMAGIIYLHGYPIEIYYDKADRSDEGRNMIQRKRGISGRMYKLFEGFSDDLAFKYKVKSHELQLAYWVKRSTYSKAKKEITLF